MSGNPNAKIAAANAGLVVMTGAGLNWTPQTYTLIIPDDETSLMKDTDDCGGICLGCLKKKEQQLYQERIIV
jgi:hypothetical protein